MPCWVWTPLFQVRFRAMFRVIFAAYLLLLSLTGPVPCCCTLGRFVALATSWVKMSEHKRVQAPACCCHRRHSGTSEEQQSGHDSKSRAPSPGDPNPRCSCERNLCNAGPTRQPVFVVDQSRSWLDVTSDLPATSWLQVKDFLAANVNRDNPPPGVRSGREIRIDIHSWRC